MRQVVASILIQASPVGGSLHNTVMLTYIVPTVNPYFLIWGISPISQLFPQPACFPLASGWGIFPISQLFPQPTCFPLASGWGIFLISQLFPQPACFLVASGWGIFPISKLFPHLTTQTNKKRQPTFIDCLKLYLPQKLDHFCNHGY